MASVGFVEEVTSLAAPATASPPRHLTVFTSALEHITRFIFSMQRVVFFTVKNYFVVLRSRELLVRMTFFGSRWNRGLTAFCRKDMGHFHFV